MPMRSNPGRLAFGPSCPKTLIRAHTSRGSQSSGPMFQASNVPGRKFSHTTSACADQTPEEGLALRLPEVERHPLAATSFDRPPERVTPCRLLLCRRPLPGRLRPPPAVLSLTNGPMVRMKSPPRGSSTLMTSAPISPRRPAQNGAPMRVPTSITRSPARGSGSPRPPAPPHLTLLTHRDARRRPLSSTSWSCGPPGRRGPSWCCASSDGP